MALKPGPKPIAKSTGSRISAAVITKAHLGIHRPSNLASLQNKADEKELS